jgi:hypothetical protein
MVRNGVQAGEVLKFAETKRNILLAACEFLATYMLDKSSWKVVWQDFADDVYSFPSPVPADAWQAGLSAACYPCATSRTGPWKLEQHSENALALPGEMHVAIAHSNPLLLPG